MHTANIRESVALMDFAQHLEKSMASGDEEWTELKVSRVLEEKKKEQKNYRGLSFATISAYGANGAIIHYTPTNVTDAALGKDSLLLLDTGSQFLDGTTDVSRTFHFGADPTDFQRSAYTRVLLGSIDLARATFPAGVPDTRLDILARSHLFNAGLNYRHGTGHGIGTYGPIHESPTQIRIYAKEEHPFRPGMFFSDEPGYYQPGEFGIRLETVLKVVERNSNKYQARGNFGPFLGFEPVCLVPFEPKMIDFDQFNEAQINWFNNYNRLVREKVGPELEAQGKNE